MLIDDHGGGHRLCVSRGVRNGGRQSGSSTSIRRTLTHGLVETVQSPGPSAAWAVVSRRADEGSSQSVQAWRHAQRDQAMESEQRELTTLPDPRLRLFARLPNSGLGQTTRLGKPGTRPWHGAPGLRQEKRTARARLRVLRGACSAEGYEPFGPIGYVSSNCWRSAG